MLVRMLVRSKPSTHTYAKALTDRHTNTKGGAHTHSNIRTTVLHAHTCADALQHVLLVAAVAVLIGILVVSVTMIVEVQVITLYIAIAICLSIVVVILIVILIAIFVVAAKLAARCHIQNRGDRQSHRQIKVNSDSPRARTRHSSCRRNVTSGSSTIYN